MEDANAKSQELTDAIRSLQRLLEDSNKQYATLKSELEEKELKFNQTLEAKNACIAALKQELKNANDLIKATKQGMNGWPPSSHNPKFAVACGKANSVFVFP